MRERVLETALRLCRTFGIKSITMQDIARECGISKKTVYEHFADKTELVNEVVAFMTNTYCRQLAECATAGANAIEELALSIKHTEHLARSTNPVLLFELEKYHPTAWKTIQDFREQQVTGIIRTNLERGIREGLYRATLHIGILVHMRLLQLNALFNPLLYPAAEFDLHEVVEQMTAHYIHGIATPAGQRLVEQYLPEKTTA
ncbi:TetR/AcrR family transcriptional regulator [Chitinophaga barathri]|uniref:TetR/AcrR family transcriptional regulator n=1 Tax=Chitinophaga barathri TaxID=1647451 RepID=A0A3N4MED6_9BACT|nr:TetR/AcrR family transcriptional regulator [Chitinophaga barathri]RPD38460.1 TetR/AcrR family transcriptional regulator [Chitinophaga barathri]